MPKRLAVSMWPASCKQTEPRISRANRTTPSASNDSRPFCHGRHTRPGMRPRPGLGREDVFDGTWFVVVRRVGQYRLERVDDAEERQPAVGERGHQLLVGRVVDGRTATAGESGGLGQAYRRERLVVERQE